MILQLSLHNICRRACLRGDIAYRSSTKVVLHAEVRAPLPKGFGWRVSIKRRPKRRKACSRWIKQLRTLMTWPRD